MAQAFKVSITRDCLMIGLKDEPKGKALGGHWITFYLYYFFKSGLFILRENQKSGYRSFYQDRRSIYGS